MICIEGLHDVIRSLLDFVEFLRKQNEMRIDVYQPHHTTHFSLNRAIAISAPLQYHPSEPAARQLTYALPAATTGDRHHQPLVPWVEGVICAAAYLICALLPASRLLL